MIERLIWKIRRVLVMTPAEMGYRVVQTVRSGVERLGFMRAGNTPEILAVPLPVCWFSLDPPGIDVHAATAAADKLTAGNWRVFAQHDVTLGFPPDWQQDPKTGKRVPAVRFGKTINYRIESQVGDIKYLWEINRHLELVTLAQAWRLTGDERYLAACDSFVRDWLKASPYPLGINWVSSLELAIRLVNWSVAWHLLGGMKSRLFEGKVGQDLLQQWLVSIYQHCHFIRGYLSLHSSANNHLLGELMGLYIASSTWPMFHESAEWQAFSMQFFEQEALVQNAADGVNLEQAVYYQHEVIDMMLICHLVSRTTGKTFSAEYRDRIECLVEYLAAIMDVEGHVPMIGDADDALIVRWSNLQGSDPYRSQLATVAAIFKRADLKARAGQFDQKSAWLLGSLGLDAWNRLDAAAVATMKVAFPLGGTYLIGTEFGQPDEVKLVVDCAPLGYLGTAAHGHADALAFTLSVGGQEILVDPGTFSYHTQVQWRNHFRGTGAHNTVRVDELDQSEIGGPFLWMRKAEAVLLEHNVQGAVQVFEGQHNGYCRLPDPVIHKRRIEYHPEQRNIRIVDSFDCQAEHQIDICWQFAESIDLQPIDNRLLIESPTLRVDFVCDLLTEVNTYRGSDAPIAGWVSRRFDTKVPAWCARWTGQVRGGSSVVTTISLTPKPVAAAH